MSDTATEEQSEALKRAAVVRKIVDKLAQLSTVDGLAIALGIYIDIAKLHGFPAEKAANCVLKAWDADREDFQL
jgi:hypothetical protein